jgi:hypothetical protein
MICERLFLEQFDHAINLADLPIHITSAMSCSILTTSQEQRWPLYQNQQGRTLIWSRQSPFIL